MKRVTALQNGEILFFSNIISKDNNLNIYCQALEAVTRMPIHGKSYYFTVKDSDKPPSKRPPKIYDSNTTKSAVISAVQGRSQILECVAGGVPTPSIRWELTQRGKVVPLGSNTRLVGHTALEIIEVGESDAGRYRCIADNSQGVDRKDYVVEINAPPEFIEKPAQIVIAPAEQEKGALSCRARGVPRPTLTWFKNNREVTEWLNKERVEVDTNVQQNTAVYQCQVENKYAKLTSSAQVLVLGKLIFNCDKSPQRIRSTAG